MYKNQAAAAFVYKKFDEISRKMKCTLNVLYKSTAKALKIYRQDRSKAKKDINKNSGGKFTINKRQQNAPKH